MATENSSKNITLFKNNNIVPEKIFWQVIQSYLSEYFISSLFSQIFKSLSKKQCKIRIFILLKPCVGGWITDTSACPDIQ